jgi:Antitoxin-like ribbon-helix-helix
MSNKFAAALKTEKRQDSQPSKKSQTIATENKRPSARQGAKHIGGYFDPIVSRQLKTIAVDEDSSVQVLLGEALDMLFQSRGKPMIASKGI